MPYAVINKSGCGIHKGRAKLRLDFFLNPGEPNYKRYADTPFHTHFIYPNPDISDSDLNAEIERCLNYFYAFHQHCWDKKVSFIDEWKKVPKVKGSVRDVFTRGNPQELSANQGKVQNLLLRAHEFKVGVSKVPPQNLNIGERGTIDVGSPATDRGSSAALSGSGQIFTRIEYSNPANADGTIDTVEAYFLIASSGNCFRVGSFQDNGGNNFTCHDGEEIGEVSSAGYHEYTGLSVDILTGEYIGCDGKQSGINLFIDRDSSGGVGKYYAAALCDPEDNATVSSNSDILSLYGTGTEEATPVNIAGTLSFSGTLSKVRKWVVEASGALSFTGAISKFTSKNIQGLLSFSAVTTKDAFKSLTGALTPSGALIKMTQKILAGGLFRLGRCEYYTTGDDIYGSLWGTSWKAQTFTPSQSHEVLRVKLKLYRYGFPGTVTVSIRATDGSGHPTGNDLCSGTTDGDTLTTDSEGEWREIIFASGYNLAANTKYSIVARASGQESSDDARWKEDWSSPTYPGGCLETSGDSGGSWSSYTTSDMMFEEWATLSSHGVITKLTGKRPSGTLTPAGALARNIYKNVAGALGPAGIVSTGGAVVDLVGNLTLVGTLVKKTGKNLVGTLTPSGVLGIGLFVAISGTLTSAGTLIKNTGKNVVGLLTIAGTTTKYTRKLMHGTLTFTGLVQKMTSKIVSGVLSFVGAIVRPGRDLKVRLSHRPYFDMSTEAKPYRDMTVESKDD